MATGWAEGPLIITQAHRMRKPVPMPWVSRTAKPYCWRAQQRTACSPHVSGKGLSLCSGATSIFEVLSFGLEAAEVVAISGVGDWRGGFWGQQDTVVFVWGGRCTSCTVVEKQGSSPMVSVTGAL